MPLIAKASKKEYTPAPEGMWNAICVDAVDLGMVHNERYGKDEYKIQIRWILDEKEAGVDPETGKQFMVLRKFTLSLGEKSHLRPFLQTWRGKKFTEEELMGFDVEKLVGVQCQVQIIHNVGDEGTVWANVQTVIKPSASAVKLRIPEDYIRVRDRDKQPNGNGNGFVAADEDVLFRRPHGYTEKS